MVSKYARVVYDELVRFNEENPRYGYVPNPYNEGTIQYERHQAEVWGFREGYIKALEWVLEQMGARNLLKKSQMPRK